jgi:Asp-tRNA(Asn)/Glu-tRNA(Gln) amidotransferase A subunit family amidase
MVYDLKKPQVPRMAGTQLKLVVRATESSLIGSNIASVIIKNMGIADFRHHDVGDAPIAPLPVLPHASEADRAKPGPNLDAFVEETSEQSGFAFETAADIRAAYRDKKTDPVEVAERAIAAIAASESENPAMRIFIAHDPEDVRKQARASKARWDKGEPCGPLDGVPVSVKDEINMVPYPTTLGTKFHGDRGAAKADGTAVTRLRDAGGLLLGKTNMTEIGIGPVGLQPHHGTARNPYDLTRVTGGSSAGSGAAVAAGLSPIAVGADGGGSIRNPASFCGVVGLKATFGRVSEDGVPPVCWSVAHLGPLAATARDCALGYALMAGHDERDRHTHHQPSPQLDGFERTDDLSDVTIGMFAEWFEDADDDVVAACGRMVEHLESKGAKVERIQIPELEAARVAQIISIASEMYSSQQSYLERHRKDFAWDVRLLLAGINHFLASDYVRAQRQRHRTCEIFARSLEKVDVIVTPTNGCTAPKVPLDALRTGESDLTLLSKVMRFVGPANLTGLPAISFPAGYDKDGLPVGFMALGRPWEEALLLRLAAAAEDGVVRQKPTFWRSLLGDD